MYRKKLTFFIAVSISFFSFYDDFIPQDLLQVLGHIVQNQLLCRSFIFLKWWYEPKKQAYQKSNLTFFLFCLIPKQSFRRTSELSISKS